MADTIHHKGERPTGCDTRLTLLVFGKTTSAFYVFQLVTAKE